MKAVIPDREDIPCNTCGVIKTRIRGPFVRGQYQYLDVHGKQWARRRCPKCKNKSYSAYNAENKKNKPKSERSEHPPGHYSIFVGPHTKFRDCRGCKKSTTNYYYCPRCYDTMRNRNSIALAEAEYFYG